MPERRLEGRLLCADVVSVEWKDKSGWNRRADALLEDISPSGACLQTDAPIPARARVRVRVRDAVVEAEVRYCAFREIGYFVGLEFPAGHRWSKRLFRPKHLFDVKRLASRSVEKLGASG
ncbi:MAG: PilZ domain-containing protein [Acidobacteriota bacterium]|nr:PilZ domain-containing protein [Acidobacteriota bacterium]